MKRYKVKNIIVAAIGLMIVGMGIGMFIYSNLGLDTASVFQDGLAKVLNIRYGNASALMSVVIITLIFIIDRSYINISSLLAIFLIGYTAEYTSLVLGMIFPSSKIVSFFFLLLGLMTMAIGVPTYIRADLGVGAIDLISEVITDKSNIRYSIVRMLSDFMYVLLGYLMGGSVGIGTIFSVILIGPFIDFFRPKTNKLVDYFLSKP